MKRALLVGCSLSDYCGFYLPETNQFEIGYHGNPNCWYNIVKQECNLDLVNLSFGGHSNEEIFHKVFKELAVNKNYDLVLVQLTSIGRKWFYRNNSINEYVIVNGANIVNTKTNFEFNCLRHFQTELNNEQIEIERTLTNLVTLQNYLNDAAIPLLILNGMSYGFIGSEKYNGVDYSKLTNLINKENLISIDKSFFDSIIDTADDAQHPGPLTNLNFSQKVIAKLKDLK